MQSRLSAGVVRANLAVGRVLLIKTVSKLATAGLFGGIVLSAFWSTVPAQGQISPGPLSRAHQAINGITDCTRCHQISTGGQTYKCLSCHTEIASRITARKGLHAFYNSKGTSSQKCPSCHSEHNGQEFTIVNFEFRTFDHTQAGYKLEGKHAALECGRCHQPTRITPRERATIRVKDLNRTFLGLSPDCTSCHRDSHRGQLGLNCLHCHSFAQWKDVGRFDHSRTRYPLTGLHAGVACGRCHTPGSDHQPRYTGLTFRNCDDCHADPHRRSFAERCHNCHRTSGWRTVRRAEMDRGFDHSRTKYPLLGKHLLVECDRCHALGDFKKPLSFRKCSDCHHPDPHGGQFGQSVGGSECSNCHTLNGFKPSTFGPKAHATTAYPLEGKHAALQCRQCHIPKGKATVYRMKFQYCTDCHADAHAAQFALAPYFNRCEHCHNLQRFTPSTFSLARHNNSPFPLTGNHFAVPCDSCHKESVRLNGKLTAQYEWQHLTCTNCHADPHHALFNDVTRRVEDLGITSGCGVCHSTRTWTDLSGFDHFETAFPLNGAHELVKCNACHKSVNSSSLMNVDFRVARKECEACHADVHAQQFAKHGITACSLCHDSKAWRPSLFNHNKQSSFVLDGAHRKVPCQGCHKLTRIMGTKSVLFYKPTPRECVACHGHRGLKFAAQ